MSEIILRADEVPPYLAEFFEEIQPNTNRSDVLAISTTPFPGSHFAVMPPKLAETCILAGSSPQACEHCAAPWQRVTDVSRDLEPGRRTRGLGYKTFEKTIQPTSQATTLHHVKTSHTTGWQPTCACTQEGTGRCIVLDPFMGVGTTAYVAMQHGRKYIGVELNLEYILMAEKRLDSIRGLWETIA